MNEQLQPLKKPARVGKAGRSGTQDDIVYAHIFEAILEQRLAPGTKLSEEALGEIFGVSRTIIRRALSRLAHESVVLLRPNRGAVVASPTVEEARQVFFSRRMVERAITELAVQHATPSSSTSCGRWCAKSATASRAVTGVPVSAFPVSSTSSWPKRRAMRRW